MEGSEKLLAIKQTNTEDKQVAENILRLRVAKAEKLLSKINDNVYDLEKYKLEIESVYYIFSGYNHFNKLHYFKLIKNLMNFSWCKNEKQTSQF